MIINNSPKIRPAGRPALHVLAAMVASLANPPTEWRLVKCGTGCYVLARKSRDKGKGIVCRAAVLSLILLTSCAIHELEVTSVDTESTDPVTVSSPVKAHLTDGSTVVFEDGITVADGQVTGDGRKYNLALDTSVPVSSVALEDVAAMESYQTPVQTGDTVAASAGVAAGGAVAVTGIVIGAVAVSLATATFGSCPTTYSLADGDPVLEAESFSYSIAPSFEARDVDRLNVPAGDQETVELIVRNEALETHYINHLELLEVVHEETQSVFPDPQGQPLVVGTLNAPRLAVDRGGRRIPGVLDRPDGTSWSSDAAQLRRASLDDFEDFVDLEFEAPRSSDQVALVFRLRNTLLNTVLFYDVMLKDQGFRALDWLGRDLDRFFDKAKLGLWYRDRMGMRVSVWDGGRFHQVARVGDQGPIAWKDVAVILPVPDGDRMRVRLSFVVDNWHIDWLAISSEVRRADVRAVPLAQVEVPETGPLGGGLENLASPDQTYVVTRPGEALHVAFGVGAVPEGRTRTFLVAAQGYYIEWMRHDWLKETSPKPFKPSDESLIRAIRLWEAKRDTFQKRFESSRIAGK